MRGKGNEGYRKPGMQEIGLRTGVMWNRRDTGQEVYSTTGMLDYRDVKLEGCRSGMMNYWKDAGKER